MTGDVCRFGVLGPLVFERDGAAVPLTSGRQRSLLALLLREAGRPISRDRLIDELWGAHPPASAVSALHVHLSKLRGLLDGLLVHQPAGYVLQGDYELDAVRFDALVERARTEPEHSRVVLAQALGLFRGEPLCDVAAEGTVGEWRRSLEEKRLQATVQRVEAELEAGAAAELVPELEQLVAQHPFEERIWGQLMLALHRAGRPADALDAYQRVRRRFAEELGLEPGQPLARLQQRLLERDPSLILATAPSAPVGSPRADAPGAPANPGEIPPAEISAPEKDPVASNLPTSVTRLVGRERELSGLAGLLTDPDVRLITLTGPGGVGKTRLLLELARRSERDYADGSVFVRLERVTEPALVAAEIASTLARRDGTDLPTADGLLADLRERELLLVIDNFEHLIGAAPLIAELLAEAPRIRVLISSRVALRVRGEQVDEVEPLPLPATDDAAELSHSPAVQLFLQCALAANRRLTIDAEVTRAVAEICRALDGLPLAIELAASRSQSLSPAEIATQLARPLAIGEHALRDLPDRQQTLQATIRWSYDLLSEPARELLAAAGVFLGGGTVDALEAVVGRPLRSSLDELLEASLLRRRAGGRFELLELVRAFALEVLAAGDTEPALRERHRRFFAALVSGLPDPFDISGSQPVEIAAPVLADHANLRAALGDAIAARDAEPALTLALGLRSIWMAGMLRQECQELVDRLCQAFDVPGPDELTLLKVSSFIDYSPTASQRNRRLAERARELGDMDAVATATGNMFGHAINTRDRDEIARLRSELESLVAAGVSERTLGWVHYFLALDAYIDLRFEDSESHAGISMEKAAQVGHHYMRATATATRLLAQTAAEGVIRQPELAAALAIMGPPEVQPVSAVGLWFVARYAATQAPETAGRWLVHAERILAAMDTELWPESVLRDETLEALGITDAATAAEDVPVLDHAAALAAATAWLHTRPAAEVASRVGARDFAAAMR